MLQPGDYIGRYEIQAVVGEGGFGKVYRAWDAELERPVAIKALSSERWAHAPAQYAEYRARFQLERRVQGQFQHPHIVSVYDLVQQNSDEYLVEEFVPGGTLRALIQREGPLPPARVVQIGREMCQAIAAAWEQDVVHRDIKPSNILLTDDGHVKLSDFGVAQIGLMSQRTQSDSHHPGTPAYMSPEQEKEYGYLDERSDLFALGLVLYETLTSKSFKRERVPVCQLQPDAPKKLERVIMRALAHDPADRYQRAAELEAALGQSLNGARPIWLRWAGILLMLAMASTVWLSSRVSRGQEGPIPSATPTTTMTTTGTPPSSPTSTFAPTPSQTHALTTTPARTPRLSATLRPTVTTTPTATRPGSTPVASAPRLVSPSGASEISTSQPTLRWEGQLPGSDYGFRVSLRHGSGFPSYTSPILDSTQWKANLSGNAVGEWRWSVAIVQRNGASNVVVRSIEWTFYYNPFSDQPPAAVPPPTQDSPLPSPTPPDSPLPRPTTEGES